MRKKYYFILVGILVLLFLKFGIFYYKIKTAKKVIILEDKLEIEVYEKRKLSSFIKKINGTLTEDFIIKSTHLGTKKISFSYINEDNIKLFSSFEIKVVDKTPPIIWVENTLTVPIHTEEDIKATILCGDNYDMRPYCQLQGEYNLDEVGKYPLIYQALDSSGNKTKKEFMLYVYEPKEEETISIRTPFSSVIKKYKTKNTKIGIDVSKWQEVIDFKQIKQAGVEFMMIRLGGTNGLHGEYYMDSQFRRNIEEAKKYQIPVGLYFHSSASSISEAKKEATWLLSKIKGYDITLPIAFDWEDWTGFNQYHLSFYKLTQIAIAFMKEITESGYDTMLYSSKNYLEKIWFTTPYDTWLAHYTKQTDYIEKYKMWQLCANGKIDGIKSAVDIDILYQTTL